VEDELNELDWLVEEAVVIDPALIDQNVRPGIHRHGLGLFAPQDSRQ